MESIVPGKEDQVTEGEQCVEQFVEGKLNGLCLSVGTEDWIVVNAIDESAAAAQLLGDGVQLLNARHAALKQVLLNPGLAHGAEVAQEAHRYLLVAGYLYKFEDGSIPRLVVDCVRAQHRIIQAVHDELGHRGLAPTLSAVRSRYFWHHQYRDVKTPIAMCDSCQRYSRQQQAVQLAGRPVPLAPMEEVGLDHVAVESSVAGKYLLAARCHFSRWVEAEVVPSTDSSHVKSFLDRTIFRRFGPPARIIADNQCGDESVEASVQARGSRMHRTTAYNPQGNAVVERGHATLLRTLAKLVEVRGRPWVDVLPEAVWADRVSPHETTKRSPFSLLYGREPRLSVEANQPWVDCVDRESAIKELGWIRRDVHDEIAVTRSRRRERFNKAVQPRPLLTGDLVLRRDPRHDTRTGKLQAPFLGPFVVMRQVVSRDRHALPIYRLGNPMTSRYAGTYHRRLLRKYLAPGPKIRPLAFRASHALLKQVIRKWRYNK